MKIGIIGRSKLTFDSMKLLKDKGYQISFIITSKESPEFKITSKDFEDFANKYKIPFKHTPKLTYEDLNKLFVEIPDIAIGSNYTGIISKDIINLFPHGILNAHGGDLPRYRGNACQAWAIINGEKQIGLCVHKMVGGELDSGDIIDRKFIKLTQKTKIKEVYVEFEKIIPNLFLNSIKKLEKDSSYYLEKQSQNPNDILRCYPRLPEDGLINWKDSANKIDRLIRASSEPYSGAFTFFEKQKVIIWKAKLVKEDLNWLGIPGQFAEFDQNGYLNILTGHKKLKLIEIEINNERNKPSYFFNSVRRRFNNLKHDF